MDSNKMALYMDIKELVQTAYLQGLSMVTLTNIDMVERDVDKISAIFGEFDYICVSAEEKSDAYVDLLYVYNAIEVVYITPKEQGVEDTSYLDIFNQPFEEFEYDEDDDEYDESDYDESDYDESDYDAVKDNALEDARAKKEAEHFFEKLDVEYEESKKYTTVEFGALAEEDDIFEMHDEVEFSLDTSNGGVKINYKIPEVNKVQEKKSAKLSRHEQIAKMKIRPLKKTKKKRR